MGRDHEMFRMGAMIGLLANPSTRARFDHSVSIHSTNDRKGAFYGTAHPTFAEWVSLETDERAAAHAAHEDAPPSGRVVHGEEG